MKETTLKALEIQKNKTTKEMEEILQANIYKKFDDTIYITLRNNDRYTVDFSKKKIKIENSSGSAVVGFAHVTQRQATYLVSLHRQVRALEYAYNLTKKFDFSKVNADDLMQQLDLKDALPVLE